MSNAKFTNPTRARLIIGYGATPVSKLRRAAAELRAILPAHTDLRDLGRARWRQGDLGLHRQMVTGVPALIAGGVDGGVAGGDVG